MRVSVLGMGRMGQALATRLLHAGHDVTIWNRTPGKAAQVVAGGAREVSSPQAAAQAGHAVFCSLTNDSAVRDVLLPNGHSLVGPGDEVVIDTSTVAPSTSRGLSEVLPVPFVAMPILGAPEALVAGEATLLLGGPPEAIADIRGLLDDISDKQTACGPDPGTASSLKIMANYLLLAGLASLAEVFALSAGAGIDPAAVAEFAKGSPLVAPGLRNRVRGLMDPEHPGWFPPDMGAKDLQLFLDLASAASLEPWIAPQVLAMYESVAGQGWQDLTAVIEALRAPTRRQ